MLSHSPAGETEDQRVLGACPQSRTAGYGQTPNPGLQLCPAKLMSFPPLRVKWLLQGHTAVGVGWDRKWDCNLPLTGTGDMQLARWQPQGFFFSPSGWSHLLPGASGNRWPATTTGSRS